MQPGPDVCEAVAKFIKAKMKDWKESNINLIKETVAFFGTMAQSCDKINKRGVSCAMSFFSEKIGDAKTQNSVHEVLMNLAEIVTPKFISLQVIKYGASAKSPNVIRETCNLLANLTEEFGALTMPLKEMIDFAKVAADNKNPQVRTASMNLFTVLYKHVGEPVKNFMKEIKESTMKVIEEEMAKATPYGKGEHQPKRRLRGQAAEEVVEAKGA